MELPPVRKIEVRGGTPDPFLGSIRRNLFSYRAFEGRSWQENEVLSGVLKDDDVTRQHQSDSPAMPLRAEAQIAHKLRSFYLSVQSEPIPQRFLILLEKLDDAEQRCELQMEDGNR